MMPWRLVTYHEKLNPMLEWTRENERIAIGWGDIGDLSAPHFRTVEDIKAAIKTRPRYPQYQNAGSLGPSLWDLHHEMKHGDLVILTTQTKGRALVVEVVEAISKVPSNDLDFWSWVLPKKIR